MTRRTSLALCICSWTVLIAACDSPTSSRPPSASATAAAVISTDVLALRAQLRAVRDTSRQPAQRVAVEAVMSVLSSGVRLTLADLSLDQGSDTAKAGLFSALSAELTAARDSSLLALVGPSLEASARQALSALQGRIRTVQTSVLPMAATTAAQPDAWKPIWSRELAYANTMRDAGSQLLASVQACGARNAQVRAIASTIERTFALHAAYQAQMSLLVQKTTVESDEWAKQRAVAARMDALRQMLADVFASDPVATCSLPPEPLLSYTNGSGDDKGCIKATHGDEAGTIGGGVSGTVKSSPCLILSGPVVKAPMPTP